MDLPDEDLPKIKPFYAADCNNWLTQASCDGNRSTGSE